MFTMTSKIQYDRMNSELNLLQHKQTLLINQKNSILKQMESAELVGKEEGFEEKDIKDSEPYRLLMAEETAIEQQQDNIDTQIEELEGEMKNFEQGMKDGIETQTNLWCFGG